MSSNDSEDDGEPSGTVVSYEAETPRGGFMARPGFKAPPRHAVVVRQGDVPHSDNIPRARPSAPPAAPSAPPLSKQDDIATLPAIPRASGVPRIALDNDTPGAATPLTRPESAPPLSDAPLITSARDNDAPSSRRAHRSRVPIIAAALTGVALGLASVATSMRASAPEPKSAASSAPAVYTALVTAPSAAASTRAEDVTPSPAASASIAAAATTPSASSSAVAEKRHAPHTRASGSKRSIF